MKEITIPQRYLFDSARPLLPRLLVDGYVAKPELPPIIANNVDQVRAFLNLIGLELGPKNSQLNAVSPYIVLQETEAATENNPWLPSLENASEFAEAILVLRDLITKKFLLKTELNKCSDPEKVKSFLRAYLAEAGFELGPDGFVANSISPVVLLEPQFENNLLDDWFSSQFDGLKNFAQSDDNSVKKALSSGKGLGALYFYVKKESEKGLDKVITYNELEEAVQQIMWILTILPKKEYFEKDIEDEDFYYGMVSREKIVEFLAPRFASGKDGISQAQAVISSLVNSKVLILFKNSNKEEFLLPGPYLFSASASIEEEINEDLFADLPVSCISEKDYKKILDEAAKEEKLLSQEKHESLRMLITLAWFVFIYPLISAHRNGGKNFADTGDLITMTKQEFYEHTKQLTISEKAFKELIDYLVDARYLVEVKGEKGRGMKQILAAGPILYADHAAPKIVFEDQGLQLQELVKNFSK